MFNLKKCLAGLQVFFSYLLLCIYVKHFYQFGDSKMKTLISSEKMQRQCGIPWSLQIFSQDLISNIKQTTHLFLISTYVFFHL